MAKTFRDTPFIGAEDGVGLPVTKHRHAWAVSKLGELVAQFDEEFILQVCVEIGIDECVRYAESAESLDFDLTSLQAVSLASALAACFELREGRRKRREERRKYGS